VHELATRRCKRRFGDVVEAIGHTPLVELRRLSPKPTVRLYAKLESHNPTGSVKDRVARGLIADAESRGALDRGRTVLEPTSGNTGIALAMICRRKGYRLQVVMPRNVTEERSRLLRMYGADITYSPADEGSNGAVARALELADDERYFMPYQYGNRANPRAHYDGTAVEILIFDDEDGDRGLALAGALAARLVLPAAATDSIGGAVTHPAVSTIAALALEAGMTGLLLAVVLAFVSSQRLARWAPLALVPVIAAIIWLGSPWTGASLNPARGEGPAVAFGDLSDLWLYLFAPSLGALAVAALGRRRPMTAKLFHDRRYPCSLR
jgi:hypothetical protein